MRPQLQDDDVSQYMEILERLRRVEQQQVIPTGSMVLWNPSTAVPDGWIQANGGSFSSVDYPDLATLWGSTTLPADPGITGKVLIVKAR